jgi:hypothetical protein
MVKIIIIDTPAPQLVLCIDFFLKLSLTFTPNMSNYLKLNLYVMKIKPTKVKVLINLFIYSKFIQTKDK